MAKEHEFLFDFSVKASLRVKAASEAEARRKLEALLDCADTHFGMIDNDPAIAEASLSDDPVLVEIDGETPEAFAATVGR